MPYYDDQWYKLPSSENRDWKSIDNQRFAYPGNDTPPQLTGKVSDGTFVESQQTVTRGYIRSLINQVNTAGNGGGTSTYDNRRFWFQFNPSALVRSISQRSDIRNILLQTPSEAALPIPGNMSFAFDILLDRQAELFNQTESAQRATTNLEEGFGAPQSIGILHDLEVLDDLIGVGIGRSSVQYVKQLLDVRSSYGAADTMPGTTTTGNTGASVSPTTTTTPVSIQPGETYLDALTNSANNNINIGNKAFLLAKPIRVVFSSLFMVEGYVDNILINFTKFNRAMVPVQAGITVTMQALYFGFAKDKTFFTDSLNKLVPASPAYATVPTGNYASNQESYSVLESVAKTMNKLVINIRDQNDQVNIGNDNDSYKIKWCLGDTTLSTQLIFADLDESGITGGEDDSAQKAAAGGVPEDSKKLFHYYLAVGSISKLSVAYEVRITRPYLDTERDYFQSPSEDGLTIFSFSSGRLDMTYLLLEGDDTGDNYGTDGIEVTKGASGFYIRKKITNDLLSQVANVPTLGDKTPALALFDDPTSLWDDQFNTNVSTKMRDKGRDLFSQKGRAGSSLSGSDLDNTELTVFVKGLVALEGGGSRYEKAFEVTKTMKRNDKFQFTFNPFYTLTWGQLGGQ